MTRRQVVAAGCVLGAAAILQHALVRLLPGHPIAQIGITDYGLEVMEIVALVLCLLAYRYNRGKADRWLWIWMAAWLVFNIFGDSVWAYYEAGLRVEVPSPGLADIGYLPSYLVTFVAVLILAYKLAGGLRTLETSLDALMFTIGAAALGWPLFLGPLLDQSGAGAQYWVNLAYPVGDLLIILGFVSFFFAYAGSGRHKPPGYLVAICLVFLGQIVGDVGYFLRMARNGIYSSGSWPDLMWLLVYAGTGVAALMGLRSGLETPWLSAVSDDSSEPRSIRVSAQSSRWRILIPYLALPIIAVLLAVQLGGTGWIWDRDAKVFAYLGLVLVVLLVFRQYVVLMQNRRLNLDLSVISSELEGRVGDLADLNERLEALTDQSRRLNTLREVDAVAATGLDLACAFIRCTGGWITLKDPDGREMVAVSRGAVAHFRPGDAAYNTAELENGVVRAIPLQVRGETLGTIWLARPATGQGPDLLPVIAAHVATAIENTRSYEEALHLAERDPLTGLYNHRAIHMRLAGESLRAQQNGSELSVVMLDMDDFKLLNDTFGHPFGDAVLRAVADAIRSVLRHADLAGRVGGDEMLIVLPNTTADGAAQFCQRLRETLAANPYAGGRGISLPLRVSLGLATFPEDAHTLAQLIEVADANLYASKQQGGNAVTALAHGQAKAPDASGILGVAGKLLSVVGARDHYTRRHSEHVTLYALALGEALGLPEESLNTLHMAAMLHDVGKIGVPGHLLSAPTALTAAEQDLMRRHVDISASVINDMPRLARVAEAVQRHHEHHDGGGYPGEVAGDDIPLLSRILAVADAYSAMTLDRPYRKSMSVEHARAELLKAAGTQLDPVLVRKFLDVLEAGDGGADDNRPEFRAEAG